MVGSWNALGACLLAMLRGEIQDEERREIRGRVSKAGERGGDGRREEGEMLRRLSAGDDVYSYRISSVVLTGAALRLPRYEFSLLCLFSIGPDPFLDRDRTGGQIH